MKWFHWILVIPTGLAACIATLLFYLPSFNNFQTDGQLKIPGLREAVSVQRDNKGMAYIYAKNRDDLFLAQGFVTAQDRLFQMQLTRLVLQGRVSELAGDAAKNLDIRMRTIGLHRMAAQQAAILNTDTKNVFQKYVDGINAFIETSPGDIHLEFTAAGIEAEKWEIQDSLGILYYMGYSTAANLNTEIITQMLLDTLGYEKTAMLLPVNINADDPKDTGQMQMPPRDRLSLFVSQVEKLAVYGEDRQLRVGSNNWAVAPAMSATGSAILSGDPHLDPRILPGVWYPTGLISPGIRAVGAHIPGIPGMAIGRTDHIALSATNNYGDMMDLYIETIDPDNPDNYLEGEKSIPFTQLKETLKIKDKNAPEGFRKEEFTIRSTRRGPVVSGVLPDLATQKPITMRFAPAESMTEDIGMIGVMTAKNANELARALKQIPMGCFNWVFADSQGQIGHQASGKIPIRTNGDGSFPYPVTDSTDNWQGWIPQEQMPASLNPEKNWVGTCNQKTVDSDFPYYYSSYFASSYRYRRLKELMALPGKKTVQDLWQYQRDTKNLMAEKLAPIMAKTFMNHEETRSMGKILSNWDFRDDPDRAAPSIFQTAYRFFALLVFEDELGEDKALTLLNNWYFWQERLERMIIEENSPFFDDTRTKDRTESMEDLFYLAGIKTKEHLAHMGDNPETWLWGKIHTLELVNPLRRKGPGKALLGSGPMPMGGSGETLYRGWYDFDKPFGVTHCAALRIVADFSDRDKLLAIQPGGVTGRTFHPQQQDQTQDFMTGKVRYWWFSDKAIDENTKYRLMLLP